MSQLVISGGHLSFYMTTNRCNGNVPEGMGFFFRTVSQSRHYYREHMIEGKVDLAFEPLIRRGCPCLVALIVSRLLLSLIFLRIN